MRISACVIRRRASTAAPSRVPTPKAKPAMFPAERALLMPRSPEPREDGLRCTKAASSLKSHRPRRQPRASDVRPSRELSLHEYPVGLVLVGDLALRVRPDLFEPAGAGQAVGGGHEVRTIEPDPLITSGPRGCDQLVEHSPTHSGAAVGRLDVHALDLGCAGSDPSHARRTDGHVVLEGQQEATIGGLELGYGGQVVFHGLPDGESEPVPRLQLVVAPREVVEPQAPVRLQISRQARVSKIGHTTGVRVTGDALVSSGEKDDAADPDQRPASMSPRERLRVRVVPRRLIWTRFLQCPWLLDLLEPVASIGWGPSPPPPPFPRSLAKP